MRILLVNYEYPPLGGGAGNATANLAQELAGLGVEVRVLTSAFRELPHYEQRDGFTIQRIPVIRRWADRCTPPEMLTFLISAGLAAWRLVGDWRPEVAITFFGVPSGPVGLALKLRYDIPYIVSLRGGDVPGFQPYDLALYHRLVGPVIRLLWRQAGAVVANSRGLQVLAQHSAPQIPVHVIPNGVDAAHFHPLPHILHQESTIRVLFVGRLVYQKGLDILLQALALIPPHIPLSLEIVGDGDARPELEQTANKLDYPIHFSGWRARSELPARYQTADIFVLPSRDEGMPNVVLEAMACGLPVVATQIAGNEELVQEGETGLLVPPETPAALAQALIKLITNDRLRQRMGLAGRQRVEEQYTWQSVAKAYLTLAESLIERNDELEIHQHAGFTTPNS
ncbi:MAG: glycosyltransferase family 4 protein [Anaerolineae bacterium]|nr:glycosyltransferase family 4 protein [Anaerolineae bacterium]